jgi:uncharacterized membrane protein YesL
MSSFFSLESPVYKFMSRLWDMLKLNVLWLLTGGPVGMFLVEFVLAKAGLSAYRFLSFLPLIFIGPATTAVFVITLRMVDEQERYIADHFFRAYRENFKRGMIIGVISLIAAYGIWLDFQFYHAAESLNQSSMGYLIFGIVASFFAITHLIYAFPLQARYENTVINTLRNSYSIAIKFFVKTIFLVVVLAVLLAVFFWNYATQFLGILIGPASVMLTISGFAIQSFRLVENENEERKNTSKDTED